MPIQTLNPATGEVVKTFEAHSDEQIEQMLSLAQETFLTWKETTLDHRKQLMLKAAEILKRDARKYGEIITEEMGKPVKQAEAEVAKCAWVCEYYAEQAEHILAHELVTTDASESYVQFDPLGIILAVMPWNYPFWQVLRFAAPALMAGNVGMLKHASNVPKSALAIQEIFEEAGFPTGAFQTLLVSSSKVEGLIQDWRIKATTLTGSEYAGSQVAMQSGREIKPSVLELGGSDPFIVLPDADLTLTCEIASTARLQNTGQSCIAAKRFILHKDIADEFLNVYKQKFEAAVLGDPMQEETTIGPLATESIRNEIAEQVNKSVELGATIVTGGEIPERKGYYYQPTILKDLTPEMPAFREEIFGPVASVIIVENEEEAIQVANNSEFGLGASIWTQDIKKAKSMATKIDSGAVFINGMVKSDPRLPFGGVKKSGYGRELSHYGMKAFVNVKTIWIK